MHSPSYVKEEAFLGNICGSETACFLLSIDDEKVVVFLPPVRANASEIGR